MTNYEQEILDKLLAKAERELGLGDCEHKKLGRLIAQADAEAELLITSASCDKVIFTSGGGESVPTPCPQEEREEIKL